MFYIYYFAFIIFKPHFSDAAAAGHREKMLSYMRNYDNVDRQFTIKIAVKRSHGYDVALLKEYEIKDANGNSHKFERYNSLLISTILEHKGIKAECLPNELDLMDVKESGKIKLIEDNGVEKIVKISDFIKELAKTDNRWKVPGDKIEDHHIFEPLFNGHAMVTIFHQNGISGLNREAVEVARFHFNQNGLNMFRKDKQFSVNYKFDSGKMVVDDGKARQLERYFSEYSNEDFNPPLKSKWMSIGAMKDKAVEIIGGKPWNLREFNCMHFAFQFVLAIVPSEEAEKLKEISLWPENLKRLQNYAKEIDKIDPLNESFKAWEIKLEEENDRNKLISELTQQHLSQWKKSEQTNDKKKTSPNDHGHGTIKPNKANELKPRRSNRERQRINVLANNLVRSY